MPAFEAEQGMPYWQDLATKDMLKSVSFYSGLLGWEVGSDAYRVARKEGLPVAGFMNHASAEDLWLTYFLGFAGAPGRVEELGGKVLGSAEVSLGQMTICQDPAGGLFGLMEPSGEDQFVAAGEPGVPVWHELVAPDSAVVDFYGELFDWEIHQEDGYFSARKDGSPFLGMMVVPEAPGAYWQTYFGVEDIQAAALSVVELGGEIIDGPADSPFGPLLVVQDSTGAGMFLAEVERPVFEEISEADSVLEL